MISNFNALPSVPTDPRSVAVGRYRVSSLSKCLDDGRYSASVSIRSGRGSASTDRVLRLHGRFDSEAAAHRFAHEQGLIWVLQAGQPAAHLSA